MADRVKYFVLGLLFLVVAGVIAYDNWNSKGTPERVADQDDGNRADLVVDERREKPGGGLAVQPRDDEPPPFKEPEVKQEPKPRVEPEPEPQPEPEPEPAPKPKDRVHVVKSGDSVEAIALKYYGTRRGIQWIVDRNGLKDKNRIFKNQKLIIPARADLKKASTPKVVKRTPGKVPSHYVVKASDGDLYAICRKFYGTKGEGARVARIMELNQLWSAKVKPGARLILPPK